MFSSQQFFFLFMCGAISVLHQNHYHTVLVLRIWEHMRFCYWSPGSLCIVPHTNPPSRRKKMNHPFIRHHFSLPCEWLGGVPVCTWAHGSILFWLSAAPGMVFSPRRERDTHRPQRFDSYKITHLKWINTLLYSFWESAWHLQMKLSLFVFYHIHL